MLDGLDKVVDCGTVRQAVVSWVERQMAAYLGNRFIINSPPIWISQQPTERRDCTGGAAFHN